MTLTNSTVSGNAASVRGGGIDNFGTMTMTNGLFLFARRILLPRFDTRSSHYRRWLPPDGCPIVAGKANNCRVES